MTSFTQKYKDEIAKQIKALMAIDSPTGYTDDAADYVQNYLSELGYSPVRTNKGGVTVCLGGESEEAVLLSGHIDTLGAMVEAIKPDGRLKVTAIGGLNPNNAEAENCTIVTRDGKKYSGTFQLVNASVHVNADYSTQKRTFDTVEVVIDEKVFSKEDTKKLGIDTGDYILVDPRTTITESGYIKSRFLDDKLSVAILLAYAKMLKDENKTPKRRTYVHITVFEEVGHGGASSIPDDVTEFLCVDMGCVGEGLSCKEHQVSICVKDSSGPSNYHMVSALIKAAKENDIDYAADIYPFYGSDADMALRAGYDIRHALIGAGVYASHGYERSHLDGALSTLRLIDAYIER